MDFDGLLPIVPAHWSSNRLHFFKYMSESTAKIVLRNRTLRWSTAAILNDPFEMQFDVSFSTVDRSRVVTASLEKIYELYSSDQSVPAKNPIGRLLEVLRNNVKDLSKDYIFDEFRPAIEQGLDRMTIHAPRTYAEMAPIVSSTKILSLTVRPDIPLMWSHYANGHRGVVMRFRSIPALDSPYGAAKPVQYCNDVPKLLTEEYLINLFCGTFSLDGPDMLDRIVYTKSVEWEYEQEWRINSGSGRNDGASFEDLPFSANELDGVIFGLNISDADRDEIRELLSGYPNVTLMQARRTDSSFVLAIEPL